MIEKLTDEERRELMRGVPAYPERIKAIRLIDGYAAELLTQKLANEALLGRIARALELANRGYACAPLILQALNGEQKP